MTAQEICQLTTKGKTINFEDVDVVTTATKGLMSGTSAIMAFRLGKPKEFVKVKELSMNDIPCYVGPCPNETLGLVDLIIYATDHSITNPNYGAGHLLRELVEHKSVHVKATTLEGYKIEKDITIEDIYYAQVMGIRHAFRNYNSFINPGDEPIKSIFTVIDMEPHSTELSFCGCGMLNPLENDPEMDILGVGTPLLINGALGYMIGSGTRSTPERPNMMTMAPLFDMKPEYMGGFVTSRGPEVIVSIAAAIPILNEKIFNNIKRSDIDVPLNVTDIVGRKVLSTIDYGQVWHQNFVVSVKEGYKNNFCNNCDNHEDCPAEKKCPTSAFHVSTGIDRERCFNCGTCIRLCPENMFSGELGTVSIDGKIIPVHLRESDRNGAMKLMNELKKRVLTGNFPITEPIAKPTIYVEKIEEKREHVIDTKEN